MNSSRHVRTFIFFFALLSFLSPKFILQNPFLTRDPWDFSAEGKASPCTGPKMASLHVLKIKHLRAGARARLQARHQGIPDTRELSVRIGRGPSRLGFRLLTAYGIRALTFIAFCRTSQPIVFQVTGQDRGHARPPYEPRRVRRSRQNPSSNAFRSAGWRVGFSAPMTSACLHGVGIELKNFVYLRPIQSERAKGRGGGGW